MGTVTLFPKISELKVVFVVERLLPALFGSSSLDVIVQESDIDFDLV